MKIINDYKIKNGIKMEDIKAEILEKHLPWHDMTSYIHKDAIHSTFKGLTYDISINIGFPSDLSTWDSFEHVLILDDMVGQPYYPFYEANENENKRFPFVLNIIGLYNKFMDSLSFLERVE